MSPITANDLLTRLAKEELDELTTTAIEAGQADPVEKAISGGLGEILAAVDPDTLPEEQYYRLWVALAVPLLYPRRAVVPDKHKLEQTWAREFLERARKGELKPGGVRIVSEPTRPATREKLGGLL